MAHEKDLRALSGWLVIVVLVLVGATLVWVMINAESLDGFIRENDVPDIGEGTFSVDVQVLNYQPIAVEKALYWNSEGAVWAGGTNVTATRLPPDPPIPNLP